MFDEERAEEYWKNMAVERGRELGVDTREGSVYMDTQAGHCLRTAKFYNDLESITTMLAIDTCYGQVLDEKAEMEGLERIPAIPARYEAEFSGAEPGDGAEFYCDNLYFIWNKEECYLEAEESGEKANFIDPGQNLIPMENIEGLASAKIGQRIRPGAEEESDESLRERLREDKAGKPDNGNIHNYKTWCESIQGVGKAEIYPLWAGENTVMAVIFSTDGERAGNDVIENVQQYVDPVEEGYRIEKDGTEYVFGDGVGEGAAAIGAHFLAMSAERKEITVEADVSIKAGYEIGYVNEQVKEKIKAYLKEMVLQSDEDTVIKIGSIGTMIYNTEGVLDYYYSTLKINGLSENIEVKRNEAPEIKEVILNAV